MRITGSSVQAYTRVWFRGFLDFPTRKQQKIDEVIQRVKTALGQTGFGENGDYFVHLNERRLERGQKPVASFLNETLSGQGVVQLNLHVETVWVTTITFARRESPNAPALERIQNLPGVQIEKIMWLTNRLLINSDAKPSRAFIRSVKQALLP